VCFSEIYIIVECGDITD